jgi:16S rRNA (guanine966-N2)-methyltransferase
MRVIAGSAKGRLLKSIKGEHTRPTSDRVKESLFSILHPYLASSVVLDLFAGSGSLGIEALSRGAKQAVFVDNSRGAVEVIKYNLRITDLANKAQVIPGHFRKGIALFQKEGFRFDLVFLDPPYNSGLVLEALEALIESSVLKNDGLVVAEHSVKEEMPSSVQNFLLKRSVEYGQTKLSFYRTEE